MHNDRAAAPDLGTTVLRDLGTTVLLDTAFGTRASSSRLLPVAAAFARFGPALARLSRRADPSIAMCFTPSWWKAVPPPRGYAHRLLVLHEDGDLCAAVCLRERTVFGLPTGILHGSDAKGEGLVLCPPGREAEWLQAAIVALFGSRRCMALLLSRVAPTQTEPWGTMLAASGLEQRSEPTSFRWRTALCPEFDDTLAPFGHRTRRNLRYVVRRAARNGWEFLPQLTPVQVAEATHRLSARSTHPYGAGAIAARLELETAEENSFSMGLRTAEGEWLSLLSGVRRQGGVTDVFWQANVARGHDSVALTMRALLMRHEGAVGREVLRFLGGTSPLMEHCCLPDTGAQTLITRPGLRLAVLRRVLRTRLASAANPMKRLLDLKPKEMSGE